MTAPVAFVDVETTGLDPDRHEIWEVGLILPSGDEWDCQLDVDLSRADPIALNIGGFHQRRFQSSLPDRHEGNRYSHEEFADTFVAMTRGLHLAGAVVSFDADRLWRLLRAHGQCPMWHYHLIDVEALAAGWLARTLRMRDLGSIESDVAVRLDDLAAGTWGPDRQGVSAEPPWSSEFLSLAVGVTPGGFDRHTALGDARWAQAIYQAVLG